MRKTPKFKVGAWIFYRFHLCQVKETEENRITCVTNGTIESSGDDLSRMCAPLEMDIKRISDFVVSWEDRISGIRNNSINMPDIHNAFCTYWTQMCMVKDDTNKLQELQDRVSVFAGQIIDKINGFQQTEVDGVPLFRR